MGCHVVRQFRVFASRAAAERYQAAVFADLLMAAADRSDGTLEQTDGAKITRAAIEATKADGAALLEMIARTPLYGRKPDGKLSRTDGISTRWDNPIPTADSRWAVEASPDDAAAVPESAVKFPAIDALASERIVR